MPEPGMKTHGPQYSTSALVAAGVLVTLLLAACCTLYGYAAIELIAGYDLNFDQALGIGALLFFVATFGGVASRTP